MKARHDTATVVILGTGCAGLNTAECLWERGVKDILLVTDALQNGTSRNTGSDKQTYYKLSLAGDTPDSVGEMARDLAAGGAHGDLALCEAAGSVKGFMHLAALGVPFPRNEYGEYVGYQTDHDSHARATSAGPLTSKYMDEALLASVQSKGIRVREGMTPFALLPREDGSLAGVLCLDADGGFVFICCAFAVQCTGGPALCYAHSVFPELQTGMSGMALRAGAEGCNLHIWQYGLASVGFRWNVSGTYQQVLPRVVSVDENEVEQEFLADALGEEEALNAVFLKGYQWPFDALKALFGSSRVDLMVKRECDEGRRVFLDYRRDPAGLGQGLQGLHGEALAYLTRSGATQGTPYLRLMHMNAPAVELYRAHGIDLEKDRLEIRVCAQHHNGGLAVDAHWRTTLEGLYAAGEVAGTFGLYRPGGSALNSTQVGSARAAEDIALRLRHGERAVTDENEALAAVAAYTPRVLPIDANAALAHTQAAMSRCAAFVRDTGAMGQLQQELAALLHELRPVKPDEDASALRQALLATDTLLTQQALLSAMLFSAKEQGSCGSALVVTQGEIQPQRAQEPTATTLRTRFMDGGFVTDAIPTRPLPQRELWFENVWKAARERE